MQRSVLLGILIAAGAASMAAQAPAAGVRAVDIVKLKTNLYVLTSSTPGNAATFSGGNVAVFITDAGVTLVDDKLAGWGQAVLDKVKSVTDKPITRIINTHTHGDHTGNNNFFGANVEIVAQEHTKTNMEKMDAFKGDNAKFLPARTFTDKMTLGSGNDRIDLYFFGAGHTSGDAFVVFPALRVLHTGDDFAWKDGPLCDRGNGGSCVALPRTLQKALATIKNIDTVIPGHSPMQTMKDLETWQRFTAALLSHAIDQMKAGKSADDATASFNIDKFDGYKKERVKGSIQAVYDELKK
jgi:cyclase